MSLIIKMGKIIRKKTNHKLSDTEWKRLNVIVDRYGAEIVAIQINQLEIGRTLDQPIGFIEKMCQQYIMKNKKGSPIVDSLLEELNDRT